MDDTLVRFAKDQLWQHGGTFRRGRCRGAGRGRVGEVRRHGGGVFRVVPGCSEIDDRGGQGVECRQRVWELPELLARPATVSA